MWNKLIFLLLEYDAEFWSDFKNMSPGNKIGEFSKHGTLTGITVYI